MLRNIVIVCALLFASTRSIESGEGKIMLTETDVRDSLIIDFLCDSILSDLQRFKVNPNDQLKNQIIKTTFILWLLYESEYKLTINDGVFRKIINDYFDMLKKNYTNLGIQLRDDPLGWEMLLGDGGTIKDSIAGDSMLPEKFSSGDIRVYKKTMIKFHEWWLKV